MKQSQRLTWVERETVNGKQVDIPKQWLMMPNEVTEFLDNEKQFGVEFAFTRLTGRYLNCGRYALVTLRVNYFLSQTANEVNEMKP